ncbi:hypothetical protein GCM10009541_11060 [Micromonospora gifhornensis]|uniref:Uncharacterized protein n=1 Tax=Micromonospora gifhornensis TaxID=84594 RepID=A0ABQ4IEQ8_9ACTN|nr:hypothetical protein Vgi01_29790 [Micromonospora gifhornensis]
MARHPGPDRRRHHRSQGAGYYPRWRSPGTVAAATNPARLSRTRPYDDKDARVDDRPRRRRNQTGSG